MTDLSRSSILEALSNKEEAELDGYFSEDDGWTLAQAAHAYVDSLCETCDGIGEQANALVQGITVRCLACGGSGMRGDSDDS